MARPCSLPAAADRPQARRAALEGRIPQRYREVSFDREPLRSIERDPHVVARGPPLRRRASPSSSTPAAGSGSPATSARARRRSRCWSPRRRWRPTGPSRSTRCRGCSADAARDLRRRRPSTRSTSCIDRLAAVDLLHIDDVGAEQTTPWVLEQLYAIVNTRYEDGKAILLTTNLSHEGDDALREQIGERTVSRLVRDVRRAAAAVRRRPAARAPATSRAPSAAAAVSCGGEAPAYGERRPPRRRLAS